MTIKECVSEIRQAVAAGTSYTALLAVKQAPDSESMRLEIHLLDVPGADSFRAMDEMVDRLMESFGDLPWLVFAHSPQASRAVRRRFLGRADIVTPSVKKP